ncbi:MAG: dTDP-4-dehydrorhamnose 3,5-epimerase [Candidatus Hydrogenedentes bacterium]|nr:dTDP-4-dehydrorhamnose 3,5-epimerase [Candidatus Hydrogenedentota bacterium]
MPVSIEPASEIPDVLVVKTGVFHDARGFFSESWSKHMWLKAGFDAEFVQDNLSRSAKGTLRGLHYQNHPQGMGKLVRCIQGAVFDVAVDLRKASPTFGKWVGRELSGENQLSLWVPVGFAHGFVALEDNTLVHYKCTGHHAPECEQALLYKCPEVNIAWPMEPTIISEKDAVAPVLSKAIFNF